MSMEYIKHLNIEQKIAFLAALAHVAHADSNLDEDERDFIKVSALMCGVGEEYLDEIFRIRTDEETEEFVAGKLIDRKACLMLVREMFTIAHADGDLSEEEIVAISGIGLSIGVSLEKLEAISQWVVDGIEWRERGEEIFSDVKGV